MARRRRRWPWLVGAALLLLVGGWLMLSTEPPLPTPWPDVRLPRQATRDELKRNSARLSWVPVPVQGDAGLLVPPARPRDPVMAALPPEVKTAAVVIEANAIRNSELGDLLVGCLFAGDDRILPALRDAGLDPLSQVDRVAIADDTLLVTGDFSRTRWEELAGGFSARRAYGPRGELLERSLGDGGEPLRMGLWNGQMVVLGDDEEALKTVLDRLDGSGPAAGSVISEGQAYGEIYGVLQGEALAALVGREDEKLAEAIRSSAQQAELHVNVERDVGMVADVSGSDPAKSEELRRSLGAALALARLRAQTDGKMDQARVLDLARVGEGSGSGSFQLQAGLPYEFLADALRRCAEEKQARHRERAGRAGVAAPADGG